MSEDEMRGVMDGLQRHVNNESKFTLSTSDLIAHAVNVMHPCGLLNSICRSYMRHVLIEPSRCCS